MLGLTDQELAAAYRYAGYVPSPSTSPPASSAESQLMTAEALCRTRRPPSFLHRLVPHAVVPLLVVRHVLAPALPAEAVAAAVPQWQVAASSVATAAGRQALCDLLVRYAGGRDPDPVLPQGTPEYNPRGLQSLAMDGAWPPAVNLAPYCGNLTSLDVSGARGLHWIADPARFAALRRVTSLSINLGGDAGPAALRPPSGDETVSAAVAALGATTLQSLSLLGPTHLVLDILCCGPPPVYPTCASAAHVARSIAQAVGPLDGTDNGEVALVAPCFHRGVAPLLPRQEIAAIEDANVELLAELRGPAPRSSGSGEEPAQRSDDDDEVRRAELAVFNAVVAGYFGEKSPNPLMRRYTTSEEEEHSTVPLLDFAAIVASTPPLRRLETFVWRAAGQRVEQHRERHDVRVGLRLLASGLGPALTSLDLSPPLMLLPWPMLRAILRRAPLLRRLSLQHAVPAPQPVPSRWDSTFEYPPDFAQFIVDTCGLLEALAVGKGGMAKRGLTDADVATLLLPDDGSDTALLPLPQLRSVDLTGHGLTVAALGTVLRRAASNADEGGLRTVTLRRIWARGTPEVAEAKTALAELSCQLQV